MDKVLLYDVSRVRAFRSFEIAPIGGNMAEDAELYLNRAARFAVKKWWRHFIRYNKNVYLPYKNSLDSQLVNAGNYSRMLSTVIKLNIYNEEIVGATLQSAQDKCIKLIRSLAHCHAANFNSGWSIAAVANNASVSALLIWHKLNDMDKLLVTNMLEYEANKVVGTKTPFQHSCEHAGEGGKSRAAAEYLNILNTAIAMMPDSFHCLEWRIKLKELQLAVFSRESDGLAGWNTMKDGLIINGSDIDVQNMNAVVYAFDAATVSSLSEEKTERALVDNALLVYSAYSEVYLSRQDREWQPLYKRDYNDKPEAALYLPRHNTAFQKYANYYANDVMASCYMANNASAKEWAKAHMRRLMFMQSRHADGRTYNNSYKRSDRYRESSAGKMVAIAYLTLYLKVTGQLQIDFAD